MGRHRMGPPTQLILDLKQRLMLDDFIEAGTYRGDTAEWAAKHFARVTTVELSPQFHAAAVARFRSSPVVRPLQGDSSAVLGKLVAELDRPAIFWLDAHWSGSETAGRDAECPVLAEIAALTAASIDHVILVDDARLFCAPPPLPHRAEQWPDLLTTVTALSSSGRRHVILFEDVLVAVPAAEKAFLTAWVQNQPATGASSGWRWWKKG